MVPQKLYGISVERFTMLIKIVKDNFFSTKKWFIEMDDGYKANTVGFKTKKAAERVCDEIAPEWRKIPKWETK